MFEEGANSTESEELRGPSIAADEVGSERVALASVWTDLAAGRVKAVACFCSDDRCYLVLRRCEPGRRNIGLSSRNIDILKRTLLGRMQKTLAIELGVTYSAIAVAASQCLRAMGLDCSASRVPTVVVMAVHADAGLLAERFARSSRFEQDGADYEVVSVERPDPGVMRGLSDAEREVVGLVVERRTNAEIAAIRSTSIHTVANQLASVVHKLGVNGRSGILARLLETSAA